jgi:hypothetical protein
MEIGITTMGTGEISTETTTMMTTAEATASPITTATKFATGMPIITDIYLRDLPEGTAYPPIWKTDW